MIRIGLTLLLLMASCKPSVSEKLPMSQPSGLISLRAAPRTPSTGKPPLLILLHGYGADEKDLLGLARNLDPRFVVRSARATITLPQGGYAWFPFSTLASGERAIGAAQAEASRQAILKFIEDAVKEEGADPERVYLAGFSQGGVMSLAIGLSEPNRVAGVVAMSARILPELDSTRASTEALQGLPVLVVHGTQDQMMPIASGRASNKLLSTLPVALTYREFPMRHEITQESLAVVSSWLTSRLDGPRRLAAGSATLP